MSTKHFESLTQLVRAGLKLRVEWGCNRVVLLDPADMLDASYMRGGGHLVAKAVARMRCGRCGARPISWGPG